MPPYYLNVAILFHDEERRSRGSAVARPLVTQTIGGDEMNPISQLFSRSPFRCLHDHANETGACLRQLQVQVEAALSNDREAVVGHFDGVQSHVLVGRAIADEVFHILSRRGRMLSVCREDILSTVDTQNLMLCGCREIASLIAAHPLSLPDDARQQFRTYVCEVLELSILATHVVSEVDVLVEVCFGGPEADRVDSLIDEVQLRTTKINLARNRLLRTMYSCDREVCPPEHDFCLHLLAEVGHIGDLADKLTSRFRLCLCQTNTPPVHATRHIVASEVGQEQTESETALLS